MRQKSWEIKKIVMFGKGKKYLGGDPLEKNTKELTETPFYYKEDG